MSPGPHYLVSLPQQGTSLYMTPEACVLITTSCLGVLAFFDSSPSGQVWKRRHLESQVKMWQSLAGNPDLLTMPPLNHGPLGVGTIAVLTTHYPQPYWLAQSRHSEALAE